jgi:hypothetical protein
MSLLDDVMNLFDRWDEGKRMRAAPGRVDELEKRVSELEALLSDDAPPEHCRMCGARAARLYDTGVVDHKAGLIRETWECTACTRSDMRIFKASSR